MARHLQDNHSNYTAVETSDLQECGSTKQDFKFNYHQNKLVFGLLLFDFNDAVREGDGERLLDLYKLALLLYHSEGHTKYAYIVLLHLVKVVAVLPEFEAHRSTQVESILQQVWRQRKQHFIRPQERATK